MPFNPYAADESAIENVVPEYSMPTRGSYASPGLSEGDAYNDEFGWSAHLRTSTVETPSAQRVGSIPRFEYRPDPTRPAQDEWARRDADKAHRSAVEDQKATGWTVGAGITSSDRRFAPNPRSTPPAESRVTQRLSPANYSFTRPFDQFNRTYDGEPPSGSARTFNGEHFSMASHRREYEAVGTMPVHTGRNTYRITPTPWDTNVVDMPADNAPDVPAARVRSIEVPSGRSWRLS